MEPEDNVVVTTQEAIDAMVARYEAAIANQKATIERLVVDTQQLRQRILSLQENIRVHGG